MNIIFFIFLTLFLIVIQTVIFPSFSFFAQSFDLLIIDVLFLSLISTHYSTIFVIIIIGCIMDSISGVPFCHHIFSYLWIYIIVYLAKQLLFKQSVVFMLIISMISIIIQHGLLLFSIFVNQGDNVILDLNFGLMIRQLFWGVVFIPSGIWLINVFWKNWKLVTKSLQKKIAKKI